jgi:hypothetical protein
MKIAKSLTNRSMTTLILPLCCLVCFMLVGCGNKFEECIQNQQEEYRRQHPGATYSEVSRLRTSFETTCSSFKNKRANF